MSKYRVKGSHVVLAEEWVDQRLGAGTFKKLVGTADSEYRSLLLPGVWYNFDPLNEALQAVALQVHQSVADITMQIARQNALRDLTTMYRVFLRVAKPVRIMAFTPRLWSTYVRFGTARALKNEPGDYLGECVGIPKRLLAWSCGAWLGFVPAAIELGGGRGIRGSIVGSWPEGPERRRRRALQAALCSEIRITV